MKNFSILTLIAIFTLSCNCKKNATQNTTQNTTQNINRVWMLVEFKAYKKEFLVAQNAFLNLTDAERASSKMGCNALSFSYLVKEGTSIEFSQGIATKMYCQESMQLEDDFLKDILKMKHFKAEGHSLILTSDDGEKMVFIAQDWD
jgi:heat shock protein HslJ